CIVDEVVIVCQHRKTATVAASRALAELSARQSSTKPLTRGVQTAPLKSGKFKPKVVHGQGGSSRLSAHGYPGYKYDGSPSKAASGRIPGRPSVPALHPAVYPREEALSKRGHFIHLADSSVQTADGHAGTEMEIERCLERERSEGLASLDGESGPFTLHCSVNNALTRAHTGALREKEASPSPASPRVTEAA
ncbi:hypothetical protein FOZ63_018949, partial [Perkinsus olseni]